MKQTYGNEYVKSHHEALALFDVLGIKEITSNVQRKNGTRAWEIPVERLFPTGTATKLKFAIYASGYVRNCSGYGDRCYQINKKYLHTKKYFCSFTKKYKSYESVKRILISREEDRIIYLANYILRNYYKGKTLYNIDSYVMKYLPTTAKDYGALLEKYDALLSDYLSLEKDLCSAREVQVIIDGHRYNLT